MKKENKLIKLFAFALIGIFGFTGISNVNAKTYEETLVEEPIPNIYYTHRGGGKEYMSAQYNTYTMNGKVVYCVEPGISITTNNYIGEDGFINSPYDDEINKKIELIGHYGYDYPGHKTLRYRIATQALIWETTGGQIVEWWTKQYGYGNYLSYDKEKKEIMKLVNAHYNKPSFDETLLEVEIGREYKITDTNELLNEYELYKTDGLEVRIDGNNIYFTPTKTGDLTLSVKRKQYDNNTTIVFKGDNDNSQKMGYFRFSKPVIATLNLKVSGGQVEILKTGEKFIVKDGTFNYEKISLKGIKFNIYAEEDIMSSDQKHLYYNKGDLVDTVITDNNGYVKSKEIPLGKYYLVEVETNNDYVLDTKKYQFELIEIDNQTTFVYYAHNAFNSLKKGTLEFTKTDLITGDVIPNTVIEIYTEKNELIFTGKTDENGKIVIKELKYGKYYIVEKEAPSGFVITDEKVYFEIKEDGEIVKAKMKNKPIFGTLEFNKIDISTSEPLPNTVIEIYTEKDELIFTGKTDENGKIVIENLRYGKYYIVEKEPPKGYILNEEKMYFEIKEDGEIVKTTMTNETIKIPNTLKDFDTILIPIGVLICGTIIFVISKKERKK